MKKAIIWISIASCALIVVLFISQRSVQPSVPSPSSEQSQILAIDVEMQQLHSRIHDLRLKILNLQVESQTLLISDWEAYTKKIQESERDEDTVNKLELQLKALTVKKQELLQRITP